MKPINGFAGLARWLSLCTVFVMGGIEARAEDAPVDEPESVEIAVAYTADVWSNLAGGARRGVRYLDNLDLLLDIEGGGAFGLPGVQFHAHILYNNGQSFSDLVGDAQVVSNIETQIEAIRLFEAWADIPIGGGGSLRFGLYDLNSEFDAVDAGALFLNSSHGIGAEFASSGQNGPSIFPVTSLALRLQRTITPQWTVRAAILDAVPGDPNYPKRTAIKLSDEQGALLIAEIERQSGGTRFVAGHWFYTRDQARFDAAGVAPSRGGYALLERRLAGDEDGTEGELRGFARAGFADRRTSPVAAYFGAGLNWSQPFMFEREHALGLAVAWAEFGRPYRRETLAKQREVNVELTYRHSLSDYVTVQPDIQLIFSPAGDPSLDTAIAAGLRVVLEL